MRSESVLKEHYRDVQKRIWNPPGAIPEEEMPEPEFMLPEPEPEPPEPLWVGILKEDAANAAAPKRRVMIGDCIKAVSVHFEIPRRDLISARRQRFVTRARQISMYLARHLTRNSLPEIGFRHGGRDHTTALHAVRKITALVSEDPEIRDHVRVLWRELGGRESFPERRQWGM